MTIPLLSMAKVVIISGGIHGCAVTYHLAKGGGQESSYLNVKKLTCLGTFNHQLAEY